MSITARVGVRMSGGDVQPSRVLCALAEVLERPVASLAPAALLVDDLGCDSFTLLEIEVLLADVCGGFSMPAEFAFTDMRVQDLDYYFELHRRGAAGGADGVV